MTVAMNSPQARQRGATLVVALIFLMVLSLLGIWAVSGTTLEERMAGNTRNRDLAMQAGEAALRNAEATAATWRTQPFDGTNGLIPYDPLTANDADYWMRSFGWSSYRAVPVGTLNQVAQPPIYVIQRLPKTENPGNPGVFEVENYRVTTRAVGGDAQAMVILQSIIAYTP
jgi:type IV pilus assembly protein PilX